MKPTQALHDAGQSLWLDNITRTQAGIDVAALAGDLQRQGADGFVASWRDLLGRIGARHQQLSK
jgi:hypothetical protein